MWWKVYQMGLTTGYILLEEKTYELEDGKKNERWWVAVYLRRKHSELGELQKKLHAAQQTCNWVCLKEQGREKSIWRFNYQKLSKLINAPSPQTPGQQLQSTRTWGKLHRITFYIKRNQYQSKNIKSSQELKTHHVKRNVEKGGCTFSRWKECVSKQTVEKNFLLKENLKQEFCIWGRYQSWRQNKDVSHMYKSWKSTCQQMNTARNFEQSPQTSYQGNMEPHQVSQPQH